MTCLQKSHWRHACLYIQPDTIRVASSQLLHADQGREMETNSVIGHPHEIHCISRLQHQETSRQQHQETLLHVMVCPRDKSLRPSGADRRFDFSFHASILYKSGSCPDQELAGKMGSVFLSHCFLLPSLTKLLLFQVYR